MAVDTATLARSPLTLNDTPYLEDAVIVAIGEATPSGVETTHVGCPRNAAPIPLDANVDGWSRFVRGAAVTLGTELQRQLLVHDAARLIEGIEPLDSVDRLLAHLSLPIGSAGRPTVASRKLERELRRVYRGTIQPPTATGKPPWRPVVYGLRGRQLVRATGVLHADGAVLFSVQVLREDLPVPGRL